MKQIRKVLLDRSYAFDEAVTLAQTPAYWQERLKRDTDADADTDTRDMHLEEEEEEEEEEGRENKPDEMAEKTQEALAEGKGIGKGKQEGEERQLQ